MHFQVGHVAEKVHATAKLNNQPVHLPGYEQEGPYGMF